MNALLPTVCLFACVLHLSLYAKNMYKLALKAKLLASLSFVGFAWTLGAWDSLYGQWLFIGLLASMIGDGLLGLKTYKNAFVFGIGAFLLAHVFFAIAFYQSGFNTAKLPLITTVIVTVFIITTLWLRNYLKDTYRVIVPLYLFTIGMMLVFAWSNQSFNAYWWIVSGATLFAVSDVFVARNRFFVNKPLNRFIGLPVYYTAQLMLAYSVSY